ncbi:hypothetical protein DFH29DRAFT_1030724 [Suillus ampliporus]|nr:hypothetical protein DFH29DRAFT_1030724 [Suillus ampliporus]
MSSNTHGTNKRQKLVDGAHHTITRPASPTRGRTPSGNSVLPRSATQNAPPMPSQSKNMQGYATLGYGRNPSTMPRSRSQTSVTSGHLGSSVSSHYLFSSRSYNSGSMASSYSKEPAAKKTAGRIRKESFKPRPSTDGGGGGAAEWRSRFRGMTVAEEDGC